MIAEAGLAALYLAAALALMQLAVSIAPGLSDRATAIRPVALAQGLLTAGAFACLLAVFVRTDLSVALVAANSHSAKPFIYRFAGAWGNHEGSMLLWVTVMALAGALIAFAERRLPERTMQATLAELGQRMAGSGQQGRMALVQGRLHQFVMVPVRAPVIIGWVGDAR